jgi:hypothetical protein
VKISDFYLCNYFSTVIKTGLYEARQFSKILLEHQISPEELVSIHRAVLEKLFPTAPEELIHSFDLLLEVMMGYGLCLPRTSKFKRSTT